jgi:hypothetical protein
MRKILATLPLSIAFVLAAAAAGCGGKSKPAEPVTPDPSAACHLDGENGTPATAEQCECAGYQVVGDIGDGQVTCPEGTTEVSRIQYGIEGGVCCVKGQPGAGGAAASN